MSESRSKGGTTFLKGPATNFFHASWGKTCSWARRLTRHNHYQQQQEEQEKEQGAGKSSIVYQKCSRGGGSQARGAPAHKHRRRGTSIRRARPVMSRVRQQAREGWRERHRACSSRAPLLLLSLSLSFFLARARARSLSLSLSSLVVAVARSLALSLSHPRGAECADGRSAQLEQSLGQGGSARGLRVWGKAA
jgi:hypothetical protein